jgi:NosR/NirI family transcriptional regulator, nitrous oxide reductase regulator
VNECLYCLHCQVVYSDDHACPVVIQKRLKRERRNVKPAPLDGKKQSAISMELKDK